VIEFPPYRLDLSDERLWRGNSPIELRPKAFQLLRYLAERPGGLVTRDELLDVIWPGLAVAPETLTQLIAELRHALEDDAHHPSFIQTVHRRGFRFIAEMHSPRDGQWDPARRAPGCAPSRRPLVGRDAELARLGELLLEARAGRRQFACVTGEPGIGKTSLVGTFLAPLADAEEPVWIAAGRCIELHDTGEAYLPLFEALERLAREAGAQRVVRCLSRFAPSWLAQLPGLDEGTEAPDAPSGTTSTRMLREFCRALEALSEERALVLWLEDVHWSDAASVDLLGALATRSDPARLLVLATYRPVDAAAGSHPIAPLKRSLQQHELCEELRLDPLNDLSVRAYLAERLGEESDPDLVALIHEQTEGNPLFIVTLVDHLINEETLEHSTEGWKLSTPLEILRQEVPESLAALIETQLDRLNAEELELLQAASPAGESFSAQAVAAAVGRDVQVVEKVCGRLAGWGRFIESVGSSSWPDGSVGERYRFLHAVFRHTIYRRLPAGLRQRLHQRIGERLEDGFRGRSVAIAAQLALHFERGGDPERAVQHLVAAAVGVRQRAGDREAVVYFERALALLATLPQSTQRDRQEIELRMALWREVNASGAVTAVEQRANLERVIELCDLTEDALSRAFASSYQVRSLIIECELDAAESVEEWELSLASRLDEPSLLAATHGEIGDVAFYRGEFDRAQRELALCLSALEGVEPTEPGRILGHDPAIRALGRLGGWTHWLQGRPDQARLDTAACLERAKACGHPLNHVFALSFAALVEVFRGDADAVTPLVKSFMELVEEYGFALPYPAAYALVSWPLVQSGEIDAAVAQLREGVAVSRRTRVRVVSSLLLASLAEAEFLRGNAKEGLSAIEEARAFVEETGERFWEAEIHRIRGELLRSNRQDEPAEACFQKALDVARAQGALSLELRAATSMGRLWKNAGRGQEARPLLAEVYGRFSEGFKTADLRNAQTLLDSL
jgi:DNA-binding winged helix-turn-helix (wHTH) protein/tetratricopeptide (TPR) repeat protein